MRLCSDLLKAQSALGSEHVTQLLQSGSENLEGWIVYALSKQFVSLLDFSAAKKLFLFA